MMQLLLLIICLVSITTQATTKPYIDHYFLFHESTLKRLIKLEEKIDGLDPQTRALIGDRKYNYASDPPEKSVLLPDPVLLHAVITERKRLENQSTLVNEAKKSTRLQQQLEKQLAADFLSLEISNIIFVYVEHLTDFLTGKQNLKKNLDPETTKILAATLTALYFSKENKEKMAFFDQDVLKHAQKSIKSTLTLIYDGIGDKNENLIPIQIPNVSKANKLKFEKERLEKTRKLLLLVERLGQLLLISNKPLWDEYQYHVLKASKKTK